LKTPAAHLELETHRPQLLRFAQMQLRDQGAAEDAVQETLVAALQGASSFAGQSSVRTWLIGILKHKIIDHLRRSAREKPLAVPAEELDLSDFDAAFAADGHWNEAPADWGSPDQSLEQSRFFQALERCLEGLPKTTARAFMLREVMGLETAEICKELQISASNCWVMLYRARMSLRECLDMNWFGTSQTPKAKA
jgi:RNA polymerase sigma-70 factor (ECF subfamily)